MYKNTACHTVSFTSIGDATGETKVVSIEGKHIPSGSIFDIESKIFVANTIGTTPIVLYTKETFEK
jgi:hypothetical protein